MRSDHGVECPLRVTEVQQQGQGNDDHAAQGDEQSEMCHRPQLAETEYWYKLEMVKAPATNPVR